jgi:hypothetical protein
MSVDNKAVLFYGYVSNNVIKDERNTTDEDDWQEWSDYLDDWITDIYDDLHENSYLFKNKCLTTHYSNQFEQYLIGVNLGDSGNYGIIQLDAGVLKEQLESLKEELNDVFECKPTLYLMNYQ